MYLNKRDSSLDVLRIVAIFFVLFTHTGSMGSKIYTGLEPGGVYYIFCIGLDTLRIICVPLFLMLSGTLLLGKTESIFFIIKKRISRIFIVLIVFSFIQYWWQIRTLESEISGSEFIYLFYTGNIRGTYWYLYCYLDSYCLRGF